MKLNKRTIVLFTMITLILVQACSIGNTAQKASHEHDLLVTLYQNADAERSTALACSDTNGGKVRTSFKAYDRFLDANTEAVQAWKAGQLAAAEAAIAQAKNAASATQDSDLGTVAAQGGTPADLTKGLVMQINAYAEAPWTGLSVDMYISIQDLIEEAYSTTFGCIKDWNDAVKAYNTERSRINNLADSGRIIGDAANALGITQLPLKLPYYESPSDLPIGSDFIQDATATP